MIRRVWQNKTEKNTELNIQTNYIFPGYLEKLSNTYRHLLNPDFIAIVIVRQNLNIIKVSFNESDK